MSVSVSVSVYVRVGLLLMAVVSVVLYACERDRLTD